MIEKITQKLESPVESPKILGPSTFPSNCCRISTKIKKYNALMGLIIKIIMALGTAPRYGPKNGITFVMPTMTLISNAYGNLKIRMPA